MNCRSSEKLENMAEKNDYVESKRTMCIERKSCNMSLEFVLYVK